MTEFNSFVSISKNMNAKRGDWFANGLGSTDWNIFKNGLVMVLKVETGW